MNIARVIYNGYPGAGDVIPEAILTDLETLYRYVRDHDIGDSLLRFTIVEAWEGGRGDDGRVDPVRAVKCLAVGLNDLSTVLMHLMMELVKESPVNEAAIDGEPASPPTPE